MDYIVFDLEWNQPESLEATVTEPVWLSGEIIEIGAVRLDEHFKAADELRLYIKPVCYPVMNQRIAALTKINTSRLTREGLPFPEAYDTFIRWCGEDFAFMTWSESDLPVLIDNILLHGMDVSEFPLCFDAQRIFDREIMRSEQQCSLDAALEVLGERGDQAHDALHDARNTVKVCDHMDLEAYIGEYGSRVFSEQPRTQVYESIPDILRDPQNSVFSCPWCGDTVTCQGWIQLNGHRFMGYGLCGEEDEFILYLNIAKCGPGSYRVSRLLYEMSDDLWDRYMDRLEAHGTVDVSSQIA